MWKRRRVIEMSRPPAQSSSMGRITYRRLRAPQQDGEVLIDPPLAACRTDIEQNCATLEAPDARIGGRSLSELRRLARDDLYSAALEHTNRYTSPPGIASTLSSTSRIYLVGHQPELFHPGVWLKNFVLDQLAKRDGATAIHVLIDNDTVGDVSIRVPSGDPAEPTIERVALDRSQATVPWEERRILDIDLFKSAGERITRALFNFVPQPIGEQLWANLDVWDDSSTRLGTTLASMRHRLEKAWGLQTMEVPLSRLCQSEAYDWFVAFLLTRLEQVHASCNNALAEYRHLHHLRSPSHPMPDLAERDGRLEAPLWIWTREDPTRRPLYVTRHETAIHLTDGNDWTNELPTTSVDDLTRVVRKLEKLARNGVKIRPRALTTTIFLRLFLGDYFIHGIGGAKYDQVTDCVIEDLFGVRPPAYMTVSGTRLLPVKLPASDAETLRDINRQLRDWEFNPQRLITSDLPHETRSDLERLAAKKQTLLQHKVASGEGKLHHGEIRLLNQRMQRLLSFRRRGLFHQRDMIEKELQIRQVLGARDFSLCLYPESTLRPWLLGAAAEAT